MRLIDADKLKTEWEEPDALGGAYTAYHFIASIDAQPTADVRENVHGEWVNDKGMYKCSACGELWGYWWAIVVPPERMVKELKFCPNCGADMRGAE